MIFKDLAKIDYYFESNPPFDQSEAIFYLIFFTIILIAALVVKKLFSKKCQTISCYDFFAKSYFSAIITCTIFAFVLLFFRWQEIPYLSNRTLVLVDLLIVLFIISLTLIYYFKKLPQKITTIQEEENYQKYFPKPKKKL